MSKNLLFPPEAVSGTSRIILTGEDRLLIEQHKGLFSYDSACIRVRIGEKILNILGEKLVIHRFGADEICIHGTVRALEFDS